MTLKIEYPKFNISDEYLWADYVELLCLQSADKEFTICEFLDLKQESKDLLVSDEDLDTGSPAERNDKASTFGKDVFKILSYRSGCYGEDYPYVIVSDKIKLKGVLTSIHKLYLYLSFCSHLRWIAKPQRTHLTGDFECVSMEALTQCFPQWAILKIFGTTSQCGYYGNYTGNKYTKIKALAQDLGEECKLKEDSLSQRDTKDGGLDLVAWLPFKDKLRSSVIYFGQCKCSEEWVDLKNTSSENDWKSRISLNNGLNNFSFIPFCFRQADGDWHKGGYSVGGVVLIDRQRIIELVQKSSDANYAKIYSLSIIEDVINSSNITS